MTVMGWAVMSVNGGSPIGWFQNREDAEHMATYVGDAKAIHCALNGQLVWERGEPFPGSSDRWP